jgi:hypothetical protein
MPRARRHSGPPRGVASTSARTAPTDSARQTVSRQCAGRAARHPATLGAGSAHRHAPVDHANREGTVRALERFRAARGARADTRQLHEHAGSDGSASGAATALASTRVFGRATRRRTAATPPSCGVSGPLRCGTSTQRRVVPPSQSLRAGLRATAPQPGGRTPLPRPCPSKSRTHISVVFRGKTVVRAAQSSAWNRLDSPSLRGRSTPRIPFSEGEKACFRGRNPYFG